MTLHPSSIDRFLHFAHSAGMRRSQVEVKEIVRELVKKGVLRLVERYVPNSPRKHYFIKSNRIKDVEGD